jgi:hypothetical protein
VRSLVVLCLFAAVSTASAQPAGKFPPDSLVNTKVIPHATPVADVVGVMRNFTSALSVRCTFCHVGSEGQPLSEFDFASDQKRNKIVRATNDAHAGRDQHTTRYDSATWHAASGGNLHDMSSWSESTHTIECIGSGLRRERQRGFGYQRVQDSESALLRT